MRYLLALVAIAGVVVSTLALQVHYSTGTQPCSINEKWDCGIVNHSSFAVIGNVPVAAHRHSRLHRAVRAGAFAAAAPADAGCVWRFLLRPAPDDD